MTLPDIFMGAVWPLKSVRMISQLSIFIYRIKLKIMQLLEMTNFGLDFSLLKDKLLILQSILECVYRCVADLIVPQPYDVLSPLLQLRHEWGQ